MSPRGFKFGVALFLAMSGLFGAKLLSLGPGKPRASWYGPQSTASPAAATQPSPPPSGAGSVVSAAPSNTPPEPEEMAASQAESDAHTAPPLSESDPALVAAVKLELQTRAYHVTAAEGLDLQSRAAILAYEADNDLPLTAEASQGLLHRLLLGTVNGQDNAKPSPTPRAQEVIRAVQAALKARGQSALALDGRPDGATAEAIRAFERTHAMRVTGRVSGELVARLQTVARDAPALAGR